MEKYRNPHGQLKENLYLSTNQYEHTCAEEKILFEGRYMMPVNCSSIFWWGTHFYDIFWWGTHFYDILWWGTHFYDIFWWGTHFYDILWYTKTMIVKIQRYTFFTLMC